MSTATAYRYQLDTSVKKYHCPRCAKRRFVRYVDTETGELLSAQYGRCDRQEQCRYWQKPQGGTLETFVPMRPTPPPSYMKRELMEQSAKHGGKSIFAQWLKRTFGQEAASQALSRYNVGLSTKWKGATVFWQVDTKGRVRMGKIMLYDETGHRVKQPFPHITNVHKVLRLKNFNLSQCFFGEHLLNERPSDPVALVESEKTAIIASIYFPQFVWIASGGTNGCKWKERAVHSVLHGRRLHLFPDLGAYYKWQQIAATMQGFAVTVNDLLEQHATEEERAKGFDLADYVTIIHARTDTPKVQEATCATDSAEVMLLRATDTQKLKHHTRVTDGRYSLPCAYTNQKIMVETIDWDALNKPEPWELMPI
jgi:hypothetical protein